jgi:predicted RNase H-like nuclease
MKAILGIDAAWTPHHPSSIALLRETESRTWECVAIEASYEDFLILGSSGEHDTQDSPVPVSALLKTAKDLAETELDLVIADIPLSANQIAGRRCADNKTSAMFGGRGCSAHSPNASRPGPISAEIRQGLEECGFSLAIDQASLLKRALVETYPHPALLSLMRASYRVPYKVGNSKKYWPDLSQTEKLVRIVEQLEAITAALSLIISGIEIKIPKGQSSFAALKPVKDKIDALVCAWVGIRVLEGRPMAIGDDEGAIWLPADLFPPESANEWSDYLASGARASEEFMGGVEDLPVE